MAVAEDRTALASDERQAHSGTAVEQTRVFLMINSFETGGSERQFEAGEDICNWFQAQRF